MTEPYGTIIRHVYLVTYAIAGGTLIFWLYRRPSVFLTLLLSALVIWPASRLFLEAYVKESLQSGSPTFLGFEIEHPGGFLSKTVVFGALLQAFLVLATALSFIRFLKKNRTANKEAELESSA